MSNPVGWSINDPAGLTIYGSIGSPGASIVNDQDPGWHQYAYASPCEDNCYWTVDGNNIRNGRNIFGTLTNDKIRIVTNGTVDRGVIPAAMLQPVGILAGIR